MEPWQNQCSLGTVQLGFESIVRSLLPFQVRSFRKSMLAQVVPIDPFLQLA